MTTTLAPRNGCRCFAKRRWKASGESTALEHCATIDFGTAWGHHGSCAALSNDGFSGDRFLFAEWPSAVNGVLDSQLASSEKRAKHVTKFAGSWRVATGTDGISTYKQWIGGAVARGTEL